MLGRRGDGLVVDGDHEQPAVPFEPRLEALTDQDEPVDGGLMLRGVHTRNGTAAGYATC